MQQNQDLRFRRRVSQTPGEQQPKYKFGVILAIASAAIILPALAYTVMHPAVVTSAVKQIAHRVQVKSLKVAVVASRVTPTPQPTSTPTPAATNTPSSKSAQAHEAAVVAHAAHLKRLHAIAVARAKKLALAGQTSDVADSQPAPSSFAARTRSTQGESGGQDQTAPTATPEVVGAAPLQPQVDATPVYAPDVVVDARFTREVQPDYPEIAKMQNAQGTAVILATIGPNGKVISAKIDQSTGNKMLDAAALSAAQQSGFQPPMIDGKPATETYRLVYTFAL